MRHALLRVHRWQCSTPGVHLISFPVELVVVQKESFYFIFQISCAYFTTFGTFADGRKARLRDFETWFPNFLQVRSLDQQRFALHLHQGSVVVVGLFLGEKNESLLHGTAV